MFTNLIFSLQSHTAVYEVIYPTEINATLLICSSTTWEMISGPVYALLAGFLGAAASLSAKLSLGADYLRDMCEAAVSGWSQTPGDTAACDWVRRRHYVHCLLQISSWLWQTEECQTRQASRCWCEYIREILQCTTSCYFATILTRISSSFFFCTAIVPLKKKKKMFNSKEKFA